MKHKAPAVHQAIVILDLLKDNSLKLAEIATETGFSKATLLRILETLEYHKWVKKNLETSCYEAQVLIQPKNDSSRFLEKQIQEILDELCTQTSYTVELYYPKETFSEIYQRSEPVDTAVNIRAKLGFKRHFSAELEAVNRIVMAAGHADCRKFEPEEGYASYINIDLGNIPLDQALTLVEEVGPELITYDPNWNRQGIRRHAAGILNKEGKLQAIVALATSFTPNADREVETLHKFLLKTRDRLQALMT